MVDRKPDEGDRAKQDEREQGKRLLRALLSLIVMLISSGLIASAIYALIVFFAFGITPVWSGVPPELITHPRLIYLLGGLLIFFLGMAGLLWKRSFDRSGYISRHTQEQFSKGIWPVVGGYWKPIGYVVYIGVLSYGAYLGYVQEGLWALLLTLALVFWLVYLAWIDLRNYIQKRRNHLS